MNPDTLYRVEGVLIVILIDERLEGTASLCGRRLLLWSNDLTLMSARAYRTCELVTGEGQEVGSTHYIFHEEMLPCKTGGWSCGLRKLRTASPRIHAKSIRMPQARSSASCNNNQQGTVHAACCTGCVALSTQSYLYT